MSTATHAPTVENRDVQTISASDGVAHLAAAASQHALRYGLIVVLLWIGGMKFTSYEAEAISGFVANSPLMSWSYALASKQAVSTLIGVAEITIAVLIATRPLAPRAALVGGLLAIGMFATTLSFLVTTPGVWEAAVGGFPALSVVPGQFLIKDVVLLTASVGVVADAYRGATGK